MRNQLQEKNHKEHEQYVMGHQWIAEEIKEET